MMEQQTELSQKEWANDTYKKVALRFIPFLMICYVIAYLDRINIGIAKLNMLSDWLCCTKLLFKVFSAI